MRLVLTNQIVKKPRPALIVKNKLQKFRFVVFGLVFDPLSKTKKIAAVRSGAWE